jgi:hypothetical protein
MAARSFVIQLQPGVGQAILPDHRKMLPGYTYTVDAETFSKISLGARQNVIKVVNVNLDDTGTSSVATASGTYVLAQASTGLNTQAVASGVSFANILTQVSPNVSTFSIAGFAAQGYDAGGTAGTNTGISLPVSTLSGAASNQTLIGPDGSRYALAYNGTSSTISGGWATVWYDEFNRYISTASGVNYTVVSDAIGTPYTVSANVSGTSTQGGYVTAVGTKQGAFAGVTLVNIPAGNFGYIQIEGYCPNVAVASGTAVGATVAVSGTSNIGYAAVPSNTVTSVGGNGVVTGSAQANNVFGTVLTAPASGSTTGGQFFAAVEIRSRRVKKPYVRVLNKN